MRVPTSNVEMLVIRVRSRSCELIALDSCRENSQKYKALCSLKVDDRLLEFMKQYDTENGA